MAFSTVDLERSISVWAAEVQASAEISDSNIGIVHTGRQNRALMVFTKLVCHLMSLDRCVDEHVGQGGMLDHFSIATLGRAVLDASTMTMYISEPSLSLPAWNLRRHVLFLHELTNRKRFLDAGGGAEKTTRTMPFFANYEGIKTDLRAKIQIYANEVGKDAETTVRLQSGQVVFIDGLRAAVREAGWDVDHHDFLQSYWSAYVHSHPVSFYRFPEYELSLDEHPSEFQLSFVATVLEACASTIRDVNSRMLAFCKEISSDPLGHID